MVAAMNGMTMTASTIAAVRMPVPKGAPPNTVPRNGTSANVSPSVGITYCDMIGTITKKPHMP